MVALLWYKKPACGQHYKSESVVGSLDAVFEKFSLEFGAAPVVKGENWWLLSVGQERVLISEGSKQEQ